MILTASRMEAEQGANPGYRAFFANGFNVTRVLVLVFWEVSSSGWPRSAAIRRDVRPRGHRGGIYPLLRRGDVRLRPRPDRVRRDLGHDQGAARRVRDVLELRRGRAPLGPRARRHARGAPQARPAVRPHRARAHVRAAGRTRSSSSPTTARRRARPSCSGTATASPIWSSARSTGGQVAKVAGGDEQQPDGRQRARRGDRHEAEAEEERRLGPPGRRPRLGQPRARLPDGGAAPPDARGDRTSGTRAGPGAARAPACRLPARLVGRARAGRARPLGRPLSARRPGGGRRPARGLLTDGAPATSGARTASPTSPTSWSTASTTPSSTRAARSRS